MFQRIFGNPTTPAEQITDGSTPEVTSRAVTLRRSSAGQISGERTMLSRSSAGQISAENVTLSLSAAAQVKAGRDVIITGGAAGQVRAADDVTIEHGYVGAVVSNQTHIERGTVGMVIGQDVTLGPGARVLVGPREALLVVAGIALLLPLVRALLRRIIPPPPPPPPDERPWYVRFGARLLGTLARLGAVAGMGFLAYRAIRRRVESFIPAALRGTDV